LSGETKLARAHARQELIGRIETAERGSRELDLAIAEHLGWRSHVRLAAQTEPWAGSWKDQDGTTRAELPTFTSTTEGADHLRLAGHEAQISTRGRAWVLDRPRPGASCYAEARTAALAYCAACLKALPT